MTPVPIKLTGTATISRQPERGIVSIEVSHEGKRQAEIIKDVQEAVIAIQNEIKPLAERAQGETGGDLPAVMRWSTAAMNSSYTTETTWHDKYGNVIPDPATQNVWNITNDKPAPTENLGVEKRKKRIYHANVSLTVRFSNFEKLSELTNSLALRPLVQVMDVSWELTDETKKELRVQTIKQAYQDAYEKAAAFAEAMGASSVRPVSIQPSGSGSYFADPSAGFYSAVKKAKKKSRRMAADTGVDAGMDDWSLGQALTYVPVDVSYSSSWDFEFQLDDIVGE